MKFEIIALMVLVLAGVAGCDSNPYGDGKDNLTPYSKPTEAPVKTYALDAPVTVNCVEDIECRFPITYKVTNDSPSLTFENLPSTAEFIGNVVKWTPTAVDARDPSDPRSNTRVYVVLVDLKGEKDVTTQLQKTVVLIVKARE